jgi:hypothetical protein
MQPPKFWTPSFKASKKLILLYRIWREQDLPQRSLVSTRLHGVTPHDAEILIIWYTSLKSCTKYWSISCSVCLRFEGNTIEAFLLTVINRHSRMESYTHIAIYRNFNSRYIRKESDKNIWQLILPRRVFLHIFSCHADPTIVWNIASINCDRSSVFLKATGLVLKSLVISERPEASLLISDDQPEKLFTAN